MNGKTHTCPRQTPIKSHQLMHLVKQDQNPFDAQEASPQMNEYDLRQVVIRLTKRVEALEQRVSQLEAKLMVLLPWSMQAQMIILILM